MEDKTTRRVFLRNAGLATAGAMATQWAASRTFSVAAPRVIGANDRINWGVIGCGSRGANLAARLHGLKDVLNTHCVAACDVWQPRKDAAKEALQAKIYDDYRKLLDDKDVDVVIIAVPEHWHAQMAIDAVEAGKDGYLEKPMTRHLDEAAKLHDAVKRTKRILQIGAQHCEDKKYTRAKELLPKLGKVVRSETSYCRNSKEGEWNTPPIDPKCTPQTLDWKAWLGPAPQHEFSPERFFHWRKYWDYSSGIAGDLLPHVVTPLMMAVGAEFPIRVAATGGIFVQKDREVPDMMHVLADFPSGHTMLAIGDTCNEMGPPCVIYGNEATLELGSLGSSQIRIKPERPYADEVDDLDERCDVEADPEGAHFKNLMDCVRSRQEPRCSVDLAYPVMVALALGEMSYRENKMMRFDPATKKIIG